MWCEKVFRNFDKWLDDHELLKGSAWYYFEAKRLERLGDDDEETFDL